MADSQVESAQPSGAPRGHNRQPRRGRPSRNRGGRARGGSQTDGASQPRSAAAPTEPATADVASGNPPANMIEGRGARGSRRSRGPRGARQPRGGRGHGNMTTFGTQRAFGGHLSGQPEAGGDASANLNANAPAFVPGQAVVPER